MKCIAFSQTIRNMKELIQYCGRGKHKHGFWLKQGWKQARLKKTPQIVNFNNLFGKSYAKDLEFSMYEH